MDQGELNWFDIKNYDGEANFTFEDWRQQFDKRKFFWDVFDYSDDKEHTEDCVRRFRKKFVDVENEPLQEAGWITEKRARLREEKEDEDEGAEEGVEPEFPELQQYSVRSPRAWELSALVELDVKFNNERFGRSEYAVVPWPPNPFSERWNNELMRGYFITCIVSLNAPRGRIIADFTRWLDAASRLYPSRIDGYDKLHEYPEKFYRAWRILPFIDVTAWMGCYRGHSDITRIDMGEMGRYADSLPANKAEARYEMLFFSDPDGPPPPDDMKYWRLNVGKKARWFMSRRHSHALARYKNPNEKAGPESG